LPSSMLTVMIAFAMSVPSLPCSFSSSRPPTTTVFYPSPVCSRCSSAARVASASIRQHHVPKLVRGAAQRSAQIVAGPAGHHDHTPGSLRNGVVARMPAPGLTRSKHEP
jgi:hypothetical protein